VRAIALFDHEEVGSDSAQVRRRRGRGRCAPRACGEGRGMGWVGGAQIGREKDG
jgi:hypothetical protein